MSIPTAVREAYELSEEEALAARHVPSLINVTYVVRRSARSRVESLVLQRLHPVFGARVHLDIEAVTQHLVRRGLETPLLIRTRDGELWVTEAPPSGAVWRALSYIEGVTLHRSRDPRTLENAARLLARFHGALLDLAHEFMHHRPIHETSRHLASLEAALASEQGQNDSEAAELGREIAAEKRHIRLDYSALPRRVIHGDPKLSNVMFDATTGEARCMIDLDTLGRGPLAHELGDALRSWCNAAGEDVAAPEIEKDSVRAVFTGYASERPEVIDRDEVLAAIEGLETISLELSSRFAADAITDSYFGWDAARFSSRREHNLVRARGQLALYRSVRRSRGELMAIAEDVLSGARK